MLTRARTPTLRGVLVLAVASALAALLGALPAAAQSGSLPPCAVVIVDGNTTDIDYSNCGGSEGGSGGGGGGDGGPPGCEIGLAGGYGDSQWCEGEYACWANIPSAAYPDPEDWPANPPSPESIYIFKSCTNGTVSSAEWVWHTPDEATVQDLAWEAYGNLALPEFTLAFSPPGQSVVFIETWWWAEGASDGPVTGSSAAGLVAIAEPEEMQVSPGDGSRPRSCPWSTAETDTCTHTYVQSSDGYPAQARLVYTIRFENNGAAIDVPGLPGSIETPWAGATVPVNEVQSVVTRP